MVRWARAKGIRCVRTSRRWTASSGRINQSRWNSLPLCVSRRASIRSTAARAADRWFRCRCRMEGSESERSATLKSSALGITVWTMQARKGRVEGNAVGHFAVMGSKSVLVELPTLLSSNEIRSLILSKVSWIPCSTQSKFSGIRHPGQRSKADKNCSTQSVIGSQSSPKAGCPLNSP